MQPHRSSALGYASAASAVHSRVYGACTAEAAASESSRLSVGGCIRSRRYFGPHPVGAPVLRTDRIRSVLLFNYLLFISGGAAAVLGALLGAIPIA